MTMNTHTYMYGLARDASDAPDRVADTLARVEDERAAQLASLDVATDDLVALAHRDAVGRILSEVRTARRRLEEGRYGVCVGCNGEVGVERLALRPWATQCPDCARRGYQ
jgi:RNA polymerase-binding transcription factor DksA